MSQVELTPLHGLDLRALPGHGIQEHHFTEDLQADGRAIDGLSTRRTCGFAQNRPRNMLRCCCGRFRVFDLVIDVGGDQYGARRRRRGAP